MYVCACNLSISPLVHIPQARFRLDSILMVVRTRSRNTSIEFLEAAQVHWLG